MAYQNNHYVPQLVLRRFGQKLCTYNVKTGDIKEDQDIANIFAEKDFYPVEIEKDFNSSAETPFANILNQKILKAPCGDEITLTRKEVTTIRKFLLLEQMRVYCNDAKTPDDPFVQNSYLSGFSFPFQEMVVEGETNRDRWLKNIRVILGCTDLHLIHEHPECTYEAYRWAQIYNFGYMAIWDSSRDQTEFIISDIGMTSEVEENGRYFGAGDEKKEYLIRQIEKYSGSDNYLVQNLRNLLDAQWYFLENFYMFSISKHRMIVVINPFFRQYTKREGFREPTIWPTKIKDRRLFEKNKSPKVEIIMGQRNYKDSDLFRYRVHSMKHEDVLRVNQLMLDRIDTLLGFTSLSSVAESVNSYMDWYKEHDLKPRKDYSKLQERIESKST